jgi:hypothetical protein
VDHVGIRHGDDLTEVFSRDRATPTGLLNAIKLTLQMLLIDVADADDAILAGHAGLRVHRGDAAATDDDVVQRLARRNKTATEDMTRDDREAKRGNSSLTEKGTTG